MPDEELTHQYIPNAALRALYRRIFDQVQVEDGWAEQVRELSARGSVLFVLPNLNWLDFLALDYLTKKHNLPPVRYSNDLGLWLLNPKGPNVKGAGLRGYGLWNMLVPSHRKNPQAQLRDALEQGGSAALFLKRPPRLLDVTSGATGGRGMREGDQLVREIFRIQRRGEHHLILLPLCFIWSKQPDRVTARPWDFIVGPRSWPTPTRALGQFAYNMKHAALRWGEPVDVGEALAANGDASDDVLVRRVNYMLLRRIERERRSVVGPVAKAPERMRTEIVRSGRLQNIIRDLADDEPGAVEKKTAEALDMLEELQATPQADVTKWSRTALHWTLNRIYRGVEFNQEDIDRVREASRDGALVLLPTHKSHIDYLVLSYFFYDRNLPIPMIAAGDNLNFKPIGPIFRRCGAFFIRRSFKGDRLYAAVVDAYIRRLIRDGFAIELFLEGGRSRTGKLLEPKLGLLNMIVDAALAVPDQKVRFLPVSIGYERVVEADSYQREVSGAEKKKEGATDLLSAGEVLTHRYGRINLQFGDLFTLDDVRSDLGIAPEQVHRPAKRRAVVTRLGNRVMDELNRVTAVTPGALTALALLSAPQSTQTESEIINDSQHLLRPLVRWNARLTKPMVLLDGSIRRQSIREALQLFVDAQLLTSLAPRAEAPAAGPGYTLVDSRRTQLDTSKNIIIHFFVERALVASSFDHNAAGDFLPTDKKTLSERVLWASRLFKHEFRFHADGTFDDLFERTCVALINDGHLETQGEKLAPGSGEGDWSGEQWLARYRAMLESYFEAYAVAARGLEALLDSPRTEKELTKHCLTVGNRMHEGGELKRREAISKPTLVNALHTFPELGYTRQREGKLELREGFESQSAVSEVQLAVAAYLTGHHEGQP